MLQTTEQIGITIAIGIMFMLMLLFVYTMSIGLYLMEYASLGFLAGFLSVFSALAFLMYAAVLYKK